MLGLPGEENVGLLMQEEVRAQHPKYASRVKL